MYRLRFVYSDGTDDFDYWDEIETFEKDFTDPVELVSKFIKLVQGHPQNQTQMILLGTVQGCANMKLRRMGMKKEIYLMKLK